MGDLYVLQVVLELRSGEPSPVRVHNVAFEEIEASIVAQTQIVRVPDEASIPPEEGVYPPEYLRTYGFQASKKIRELCRVWIPEESPHGRPRSVNRRSNDCVADICAEPLDVEGIVQERVADIVWVVRDVEDGVNAKDIRQHEEVEVQPVVPDHEPVIGQPAKRLRQLRYRDPLGAFDRHQGGEEVGDGTRATDPGQEGRYRDDPLAPDRRRKEPAVVADDELQVLDFFVFDQDLEACVALDLRDGVYRNVSRRHAGRYQIVPSTCSTSAKRKAPSSGTHAPYRRPVLPR